MPKIKIFSSYDDEEYHVHDYHRLIEEEEYGDEDSDKEGSPPRVIQRRESMIFDFLIDKREREVVESPLIEL